LTLVNWVTFIIDSIIYPCHGISCLVFAVSVMREGSVQSCAFCVIDDAFVTRLIFMRHL